MPITAKQRGRKRKSPVAKPVSQEKNKKEDLLPLPIDSGVVLTLGQGDVGQLGLGDDIMERKRPALLKEVDGIKFIQVTCGGMHTVAVTEKGEVYTWGCNDDGALGRHAEDGEEFFARKVSLPEDLVITMVSAGDSHTAALTNKGEVYAWGAYRDASGQIGLTAASLGKKNEFKKIYPKENESNNDRAVKIVSGNDHTVILTEGGDLYTSGSGEQGQLGRVKECFGHRGGRRGLDFILAPQIVRFRRKVKFSDIFAGSFCTFAVSRESSDVYAWGLNNYGQLGTGNTENLFNPQVIASLTKICVDSGSISIESGQHHTIVLDGKGNVYSIGRAEYGRLGLGDGAKETALPEKILELKNHKVVAIACGEAVSFAITDQGFLYSWGLGTSLQLGVGDEEDITLPTQVKSKNVNPDEDEVLSASAGGQHTALLVQKRKKVLNNEV